MTKRMLIDATHDEETRVAVVDGRRLVEFDYESKFRKPLKGSIFLAKVTRVEPSLQAAFVNFGGNRHGFLPFAEIHPDYFRIPIADREALLAEQQAMIEEQEAAEREREQREAEEQQGQQSGDDSQAEGVVSSEEGEDNVEYVEREDYAVEELGGVENVSTEGNINEGESVDAPLTEYGPEEPASSEEQTEANDDFEPAESFDEPQDDAGEGDAQNSEESEQPQDQEGQNTEEGQQGEERGGRRHRYGRGRRGGGRGRGRHRMAHRSNRVEKFGGEDYSPEERFRFALRRKYKIQEVIKRGQIMLVQVSKEERGNKGAAVSTYLSLPGRYCVLMPNSPRAGGVSRKIANYEDRARMKEIMQEITVPTGMSVIVRTAGVSRSKAEINRDLDYLMRLWDNIRELTLQSTAPSKVYEEADLIKRAVRDLYGKDIEEIIVEGQEGFNTARNFMKMMMPTHIDRVVEHNENVPLFTRYHVEEQIAEIGEARVTLPSGGYLIINQTEALVAVDVNSGKATKERHIEETALKTNMEAASEIARQLRLRDLGGLVVIDFIDMEDRRNNGKVERRVREALSSDRARIQMSRISSFGLMELSRQRLNPSLTESQFETCPHCAGLGRIRTCDAMSIMVLRAIESEGLKGRGGRVVAHVSNDVAVYILNNKRKNVTQIESRYDIQVLIRVDETVGASSFRIETTRGNVQDDDEVTTHHVTGAADASGKADSQSDDEGEPLAEIVEGEEGDDREQNFSRGRNEEGREGRGGRRRGRRGGRNRGRREWRDRDENGDSRQNFGGEEPQSEESIGNQRTEEQSFAEEDEFQDAAAHQALHDRDYQGGGRVSEARREQGGERGRRAGGRGRRGGRGRDRGGRGERSEGHRSERSNRGNDGNFDRPRRNVNSDGAQPSTEYTQTAAPGNVREPAPVAREEKFNSFEAAPARQERTPPAPRTYEKKEYENLNPEPAEKKRGWWNRLTE